MASLTGPDPDNILLNLLRKSIGDELKIDLMKIAEEQVDAAVDRAIAGLETHIQRAFDQQHAGHLVKVIVERRP
jgi:hypothetical protein